MSEWKGVSQEAIDEVRHIAEARQREYDARRETAAIRAHAADYKPNAWDAYTMAELGQWVHLLSTRAGHRDNPDKRAKDLYDAQNYLDMMQAKLDALKATA